MKWRCVDHRWRRSCRGRLRQLARGTAPRRTVCTLHRHATGERISQAECRPGGAHDHRPRPAQHASCSATAPQYCTDHSTPSCHCESRAPGEMAPPSKSGWLDVSDGRSKESHLRRFCCQVGFHLSLYQTAASAEAKATPARRRDLRNALCIRPTPDPRAASTYPSSGVDIFWSDAASRKPRKTVVWFAGSSMADGEPGEWLRLWCSAIDVGNVDGRLRRHRDPSLVHAMDESSWDQEAAPPPRTLRVRILSVQPARVLLSPRSRPGEYVPTAPAPAPTAASAASAPCAAALSPPSTAPGALVEHG